MNRNSIALAVLAVVAATSIAAQENVTDIPPRPMEADADPVNRLLETTTVSGLLVSFHIDGDRIALGRAQPARMPKPRERAKLAGETVTVTGLSDKDVVASVTVADPTQVVVEEAGLYRAEQRTLDVALPTPRAIDAVEVRVSATGATARFDVRPVYAEICAALPRDPVCTRK